MDTADIRRNFVAHFENDTRWGAHTAVPSASLLLDDPTLLFVNAGMVPVQALLPGPGDAAVPARGERAEVRAHPRHRGRRQDHPARHVLRDVRQLLLRRLLQAGRHRAGLGPGHQAPRRGRLGARGEQALPQRVRRRPRGARAVAQGHRPPGRADPAAGQEGELLVDGRARAGRPVLGDPLRPRARPRTGLHTRAARAGHAGQARGPAAGDLEPGLHAGGAVRGPGQGRLRHHRPAAQAEHRHRHGPRARRVPAPGRRQHVRDRRDVPGDRAGRRSSPVARTARTTRTTSGSGWWPTTSAAR